MDYIREELSVHSRPMRNVLKVHGQNSYDHERAKFEIVMLLEILGRTYYTEATFRDGPRADIIVADVPGGLVIEVETKKDMILTKAKEQLWSDRKDILVVYPLEANEELVKELLELNEPR